MKSAVKISSQAESDLWRNMCWWAEHHSVAEALDWESVIRQQVSQVGFAPESYGLSMENNGFPFVIRDAPVGKGRRGSYRAVFTVQENSVIILRVVCAVEPRLSQNDIHFL